MFSPPNAVFGFSARVRGNAQPTREGSVPLRLVEGGVASATFLRWNMADFKFDDLRLNSVNGWFLTFVLETPASRFHLSQGNDIFWTTEHEMRVDAIDAAEIRREEAYPSWMRRSNRFWPSVNGKLLPFLGQASTTTHHVYLFGRTASGPLAAHLDVRDEQDVEDHYDQEA